MVRNFFPVFLSRGVVQISAYVDSFLASFLPTGAVSALAYAQTLNSLPVSLFGMAISAAELPAMSSALGTHEEIGLVLRQRLENGPEEYFLFRRAFGGGLCRSWRRGRRHHIPRRDTSPGSDVTFVWSVLAGSGVGLLASTSGRLYSSAFYALRDTRTPLNFAIIRVVLTVVLGYLFALPLPRLLGIDPRWGVAGLTLSAGMAGWVEFALLRRALQARIGAVGRVGFTCRTAMGGRSDRCCVCLRSQARAALPPSRVGWVVRAFDLRAWLSLVHQVAWSRCPG